MSASQSPPEPSTPGTPTPVLSVRIVSIDYYMSPPLPGFDFSRSPFHGALPSPPLVLFLLLPRVSNLPLAGIEPVATQARSWRRFRSSGSTAPPPRGRRLASTSTGYYPHEVSRAATLLLSGAVLNRSLQPYESHIPYLLHFLIDYNLYGMGHIHVKDFKFRILNEKYKMYTSLSQTTEGTKMVQSLVAIWEEIERLRLLEETKYADLGRPLREEVLKGFLHDIKYESALSMLFSQEVPQHKVSATEDSERLERCFKSLTDIVGTVTFSQDDYCDDIDVGNSAGMQDKPNASLCSGSFKQTVQTISPERNSEYVVSSSVTQRMLSQLSDEGEKQVDAEALGLLSWLASSQAAEDPTTDDELINEVILSPLFGKKSIEVALESAHLDFDSASQQECQDILDSVDPVLTESRGELRPDPWFDAINAVSLAIEDDADNTVEVHVFIRDNSDKSHRRRNLDGIAGCNVDVFPEEKDLLNNLISAVCSIDPDILVGWEIQLGSLGFLAERAAYLGIGLLRRISRTPPHELNHPPKAPVDDSSQVLAEASSADDVIDDVKVKLNNYSLEAVADEVLRRKIPLIPSRIFNARQLALKLIANVTYGYTAAGFSGRMPCAELADSIVQCGRRTLETAISFVNQHPLWKARVVYGDTDSMFVLLKGHSREEAFRIGKEIAASITAINPDPVTLKFEKVYQPCFLLTKKRYVGYSYESPEQNEPIFDAKGIETVRRDTCPAVAKILERSIRIMFEEQDLTKVRSYLERQWTRILSGCPRIDFIGTLRPYTPEEEHSVPGVWSCRHADIHTILKPAMSHASQLTIQQLQPAIGDEARSTLSLSSERPDACTFCARVLAGLRSVALPNGNAMR
nr:unnamed protein product [Digitaria exilis]